MITTMKNIISLAICVFISACSINAPKYTPSNENINILQDVTTKKISVGKFNESSPKVNSLSMRGSSLVSPYNESYSVYLTKALEEELKLAGIWDQNSGINVSGTLVDNELDVSSFSIGTASITVKFIVKRNNKVIYNKQVTANHKWESSFIGAVAIPAGQNNYHVVVQKLFTNLFKDKQFIAAVK